MDIDDEIARRKAELSLLEQRKEMNRGPVSVVDAFGLRSSKGKSTDMDLWRDLSCVSSQM